MKLTQEQKAEKQARENIRRVVNRVSSEFSFRKWCTYHAYLHSMGSDIVGPDKVLTRPELDELLRKYEEEAYNQLNKSSTQAKVGAEIATNVGDNKRTDGKASEQNNSIIQSIVPEVEEKLTEKNNYGLWKSEKEVVKLFWFQRKSSAELLNGILHQNKHGQFLIAAAGSGKTYSIGAVLRRLIDISWHKKNTMSPWPIIYVTKASVVTQTQRVLEKDFQIDTRNEVTVLGIDQLRARFGAMFVKEQMTIVAGEEHVKYVWTPMINPKLIVWDEAHSLKNHTSKQHRIALSYSELPDTYQIFSSATPAARVSEFKAFTVAARITVDI